MLPKGNTKFSWMMPDSEGCTDRRLETFQDFLIPDQETPSDEFPIRHLAVCTDGNSWRPYLQIKKFDWDKTEM